MWLSLLSVFSWRLGRGVLLTSLLATGAWGCSLDRKPVIMRGDGVTAMVVGQAGEDDDRTPAGGEAGSDQGGGGSAGERPSVPCDCDKGCSAAECSTRENGAECRFDSQCKSLHCNQNICCGAMVCCNEALPCEGAGVVGRTCDTPSTCQGSRGEVACMDFGCTTRAGVSDDSACDSEVEASTCGAYPAIFCSGEAVQSPPDCASSCEGDEQCDATAVCRAGECVSRVVDGSACTTDAECESMHCSGGFCCADGDCCATASDCPDVYSSPPVCDSEETCQGSRSIAVCQDATCATMGPVDDDSACDTDTLAATCGAASDLFCSGEVDQVAPSCSDGCQSDADCDDTSFCSGTGLCVTDGSDGAECDRNAMCDGGRCSNGRCCAAGICCNTAADCPARFTTRTCSNVPECQGERFDAVCLADNSCETSRVPVDDDSGCTAKGVVDCGDYRDLSCSGEVEQAVACSFSCASDDDCDPGIPCRAGACIPRTASAE